MVVHHKVWESISIYWVLHGGGAMLESQNICSLNADAFYSFVGEMHERS